MLDWMKKLFNKEEHQEEKTAVFKEVSKKTESQPKIPRVNHYTEEREAQMASRNLGVKCRFPLIPDGGLDQEDVEAPSSFEVQPIHRAVKAERHRQRYVEQEPTSTYTESKFVHQSEEVPEPFVQPTSVPVQENNRRPFRPTEIISPIYGHHRPSVEKKVVQEEEKEREDLEISVEGKSVVDAWLEKKGYTFSYFSEEQAVRDFPKEEGTVADNQETSKQKGKSVVDEWLEKNSYEIEHQASLLEENSDDLIEQQTDDFESEQHVVALLEDDRKTLQSEAIDTKHIEEQDEKKAAEEAVIIKSEEALVETIVIETENSSEEEFLEEEVSASEPTQIVTTTEAEVEIEAEALEEAEIETEDVAQLQEESTKEIENTTEYVAQQEAMESQEDKKQIALTSESLEKTKKDVQSFANTLIEEREETQSISEETQPVVQTEEPKREKKRHVPFNVVMLKQDRRKLMEKHRARMNAVQQVEEVQIEEKPVQQVEKVQIEEKPVQQVEEKVQVIEQSVQQIATVQQTKDATANSSEKEYVVAKRENDVRNVLQTPPEYMMPPLTLLTIPAQTTLDNTEWLDEQKQLLDMTFNNFHVGAHVINVSQGPAVTRFEVQPDPGVKVNKITNLSDDIKLSLAAKDIRIEAPIPGKSAIGIEVPNKESKPVFLREILRSPVFTKSESPLTVALGLDISGAPIVTDIRKMPHGLIAGATGSGKSVCINAILTSILYKAKPHEVKLMLIDPKMVELAPYNSVPHLVAPVITDVKAATAALKWAVDEMERRYELFAHAGARDLTRYNTIVSEREIPGETLPYIVIVIDELADLMMVAPGDVEEAICRIAQKARACGIHLLVATQRPSVDVITGLIKSNIPTRIAFTVSSQVDSRTIIDIGGAEKLLGRGDMLFLGNGTSKPVRVQGVYVSDDEIEKTVEHVKKQMKPNYLFKQEDLLAKTEQHEAEDELFFDACQFVVEQGGASTSSVQRKFRIGYNRAARLIEEMEAQGIISEAKGTKPRDVLISEDEFAAMQEIHV
ncbi:DNA translocase FtsK [Bacillus cytotoxicus]|uniref:DNA translocase FtsK n=1 Tax=Bacillus cereus group sp. BfR-BA-01492 TaxID=2920361 RepID=UPI001F56FB2B|nr:DNA translocase FtsK [Bacillus cereus group sp. BfR-BA-01492]EMA6342605.1 DNA translocase FtsK [Bacillus cytotoxicus]